LTRIGIVGIGKIARDQHIPAIGGSGCFELVACASRHARVDGVDNYPDLAAMLEGRGDLDAIAICTPPQVHYEAAQLALESGKHVLLEKPPCATTRQLEDLAARARRTGRTLFQTWHSRYAAGVAPAREWLKTRTIISGRIIWKEDVRQWHPGQTWIWRAGGFGVFDPGINAISILTDIASAELFVSEAKLYFPSNCEAPIAADLTFTTDAGAPIAAEFDFRQVGPQSWDIELQTDDGALALAMGGSVLRIDGVEIGVSDEGEYPALYRRFAELIGNAQSDVDSRPFQLTADAFLVGARTTVEPFVDELSLAR
jgi:predicted dehydrogenase